MRRFYSEIKHCKNLIKSNTEIVQISTIHLHLITSNCSIYHSTDESQLPFPSPWWGFVWPGGLTIAKYLHDHPEAVKDKAVLDIGSGCGIVSILAAKYGAKKVLSNDIDVFAGSALELNLEINPNIDSNVIKFSDENLLQQEGYDFNQHDVIFCGDMLYDSQFSNELLKKLTGHRMVVFGDPGRWCCPKNIQSDCLLAEYSLDGNQDGFHTGRVFRHL